MKIRYVLEREVSSNQSENAKERTEAVAITWESDLLSRVMPTCRRVNLPRGSSFFNFLVRTWHFILIGYGHAPLAVFTQS